MDQNEKYAYIRLIIVFILAALVVGFVCYDSYIHLHKLPPQSTCVYELPPQFEGKDILPSWRECEKGARGHEGEVTKMRQIFTEKSISTEDPEERKKYIDYAEKLTKWEQECRAIDRERQPGSEVVNVRNRGDK